MSRFRRGVWFGRGVAARLHYVAIGCLLNVGSVTMNEQPAKSTIARHKTAIKRQSFSLPVKCMLRDGLLDAERTFFDYGSGHGQDLAMLSDMSIQAAGWDPVHRPNGERQSADVVNLGYVINVIEDPSERQEVLRKAWNLCNRVLTVAAQVEFAAPDKV